MVLIIDNEITLNIDAAGEMVKGVYKEGEPTQKKIKCNVQPSSREMTYGEYGFYIEAEYKVFCYADMDIKEGSTVIYKGAEYKITKLVDWNDYYILYLKAVI